jgi:predicted proteasome-type protease
MKKHFPKRNCIQDVLTEIKINNSRGELFEVYSSGNYVCISKDTTFELLNGLYYLYVNYTIMFP